VLGATDFRVADHGERTGRQLLTLKAQNLAFDRRAAATAQTRTRLCRHSNQSLSAPPIPAGKRISEGRDRAGVFGHGGPFHATEPGRCLRQSERLFNRRDSFELLVYRVNTIIGLLAHPRPPLAASD
jgi:hypothetical protein